MSMRAGTVQEQDLMDRFMAALQADGLVPRSREAHRCAVERLAEFMAPRPVALAGVADVRAFLAYLGQLGVSTQSQGVYRSVLMRWMEHVAIEQPAPSAIAPASAVAPQGQASASAPVLASVPTAEPVDFDQTWPLWKGSPLAASMAAAPIAKSAAEASGSTSSAMPYATSDSTPASTSTGSPTSSQGSMPARTPDFGSAFDAAEAAARAAQTISATSWEAAEASIAAEAWPPPGPSAAGGSSIASSASVSAGTPAATPATKGGFAFASAPPPSASTPSEPSAFGFGAPGSTVSVPEPQGWGSSDAIPRSKAEAPQASAAVPPVAASPAPVPMGFGMGDGMSSGDAVARGASSAPGVGGVPAFIKAPPMTQPVAEPQFDAGFVPGPARPTGKGIALSSSVDDGGDVVAIGADESFGGRRREAPAPVQEESVVGWSVRIGGTERKDLTLTEVRNMAASGALTARTMVRRPGGEWMQAGEFHPLRSALIGAVEASRAGAHRIQVREMSPHLRSGLAWIGAILGAGVASAGWWLGAIVASRELAPLAILGGLIGGFAASWFSQSSGRLAALPGAAAGIIAPLLGRYLVFETLRSGVVAFDTSQDPVTFQAFATHGWTLGFATCLFCASTLGALLGGLGAGRSR